MARLKSVLINIDYNFYKLFENSLYGYFKTSKYIITKNDYNLCGSQFGYDWVKKRYKNVSMFVEPISLEFLNKGLAKNLNSQIRDDIVLYNPSKSSYVLDKLLSNSKFNYVPIRDLDISGMIELFRKAKLYIDFGEFGGPERLPKETVYNGTLLLVANHNAASNDFDVAVPNKYKVATDNIEEIEKIIGNLLLNYDNLIKDFNSFRNKIDLLEENFINDIKSIFKKTV